MNHQAFTDDESVRFLNDPAVRSKFENAKKLSDVKVTEYDAIFYVGGHGPVLDLASDPVNASLASEVMSSFFIDVVKLTESSPCSGLAKWQDRFCRLPRNCVSTPTLVFEEIEAH